MDRHSEQQQHRPYLRSLMEQHRRTGDHPMVEDDLLDAEIEHQTPCQSVDLVAEGNSEATAAESSGSARGTANVRSRVRYWLNDIVDEMRKKSPASVQKWVDSIQIPTSASAGGGSVGGPVASSQDDGPTDFESDFSRSNQLAATASRTDELDPEHGWEDTAEQSESEVAPEDTELAFTYDTQAKVDHPERVLIESNLKKNIATSTIHGIPSEPQSTSLATSTPKAIKADESAKQSSVTEGTAGLSIRNFLTKKSLLGKFSRSGSNLDQGLAISGESENPDTLDTARKHPEEGISSTPSRFVVGKSKINEFYDKLNMNKAKYGLIKAKKLDIRNMLSGGASSNRESSDEGKAHEPQTLHLQPAADEFITDGELDPGASESEHERSVSPQHLEPLEVSVVDVDPSDAYEFSFDESFPKSDELIPGMISEEDEEEKENILDSASVMPGHGHGYDAYLNPPKPKTHRMGIGRIGRSSSENPRATARRYNLMEIGRSFSEMNDDDDSFAISECNNSCPNPSSLNTSSSINNGSNNNLTRSVPVSPIPRTSSKLSIQQDPQQHQLHNLHQQQQQQQPSSSPRRRSTMLVKDSSLQSDSSRCSSVESLLNARKPDPEKILLNLGFGPAPHSTDVLAKIPKRFLKPSQVRGVDTEAFLRQQQLSMHIHENSVLGYRGLVGNPHIPPSMIVAKIMERFQENDTKTRLTSTGVPLLQSSDSRNSSGPPSPVPMTRHASLATADGRLKY
uniref:ITPR-interacting domain-containing protein n=1 Tax=Anopheles culicifacies TaxID=139723 RepID=A0A182MD20_9DIPT